MKERENILKKVEEELKNRVIRSSRILDDDIENKIRTAFLNEEKKEAKIVLDAILKNIDKAKETGLPLCQDTGLFWVLIDYAKDSPYSLSSLVDTVNSALEEAAEEGYFRKSIVGDPIFSRRNTKTNMPPVINIELIDGQVSRVHVLLKGFGSENCSSVVMLNPTEGKNGVVNAVLDMVKKASGKPCPPMFLAIGVGGTMDRAAVLSKKAMFYSDPQYKELEDEILNEVNKLKIGSGGLGGNNTALSVSILAEPTHIAGLPVALSISCWADRKTVLDITEDLYE